ncbi:hypothetical protein BD309DRAFT_979894 [Dichomitus squalens]|uniref:Uncharacterized protein n=1 Tax=Dichomitus squalens TaxID=114155 RepID=A0A4Q9PNY6_9APHY|nr:hypothetical protein BD309DRAFT_979894 [Dichomitus squalens]TBU56032.1 hypothetical protein BD310DRAFT_907966 [Dichomitus squalens]
MTTQTRSFIVFKDEPEDVPAPVVARTTTSEQGLALAVVTSPTNPTIALPPSSGPLVYCPDKENIDPLSGSRALSEHSLGKKRKTALAVKAQPASPSKKPRPLTEKPIKQSSSSSKSRSGSEKKAKAKRSSSTSSKRTASSKTRREPSLPRLAEEGEEPAEAMPLDQDAIDAKCKELTVLPLADISEAYEQATTKVAVVETAQRAVDEKVVAQPVFETIERAATPPPVTQTEDATTSPVAHASTASAFSTPERKRIYAAFTFSSPSLASQRYASARGSSVDRFSDVVF